MSMAPPTPGPAPTAVTLLPGVVVVVAEEPVELATPVGFDGPMAPPLLVVADDDDEATAVVVVDVEASDMLDAAMELDPPPPDKDDDVTDDAAVADADMIDAELAATAAVLRDVNEAD